MARLIRMDKTGHTTLAEWTTDDPASVEAAVTAFRRAARRGLLRDRDAAARATPSRCASCRSDAGTVILRRPIAGGC